MSMNTEEQKAFVFVNHLLSNPALQPFQLLQKEEQIISFLKLNSGSLMPTLSSAQFFPGKDWQQILAILYTALTTKINEMLFRELDGLLGSISYTFVSFLRQINYPLSKCKDQIFSFEQKILNKFEARNSFIGAYTAARMNIADKYIEMIFRRREYIYFELCKVQRLKMGKEEIKNFINLSLILKNAIHLLAVGVGDLSAGTTADIVQKSFADKAIARLKDELKLLPPELVASAVNSNVSFLENKALEATSRLASIFASRCRHFKPYTRIEKGAELPDKSWFMIARKNYKYYGFDIKILDELYKIAAENGW